MDTDKQSPFTLKPELITKLSEKFLDIFGRDGYESVQLINSWLCTELNKLIEEHQLTRCFPKEEWEVLKLNKDKLIEDSFYFIGESFFQAKHKITEELMKNYVKYDINYLIVK